MKLLGNFKFILASTSPRRIELLNQLNLNFEVITPIMEEIKDAPIRDLSIINSFNKAYSVAKNFRNKFVAGFDTVVIIDDKVLGKPYNENDAYEMLKMLSGKKHYVVTGLTILNLNLDIEIKKSVSTEVYFKTLTQDEIKWYISTKEPFDKAGAYGIQGKGSFMISKIIGSYTNVVGLPLAEFISILKELSDG